MPFQSRAQARWAHSAVGTEALGGAAHVREWDESTDFNHLPERRMATEKVDLGKKGSFSVKKGALHEMLGIESDKPIPTNKLQPHAGDSTLLKRRKASARGFRAMNHG